MPTTPNYAIPYPAATDPVAQGAAAMQAIASAVDTELKKPKWIHGAVNADGTSSSSRFTSTRTGTGIYTVTLTPALPAITGIFLQAFGTPGAVRVCTISAASLSAFTYFVRDIGTSGGNPQDALVYFLVIGE